MSPVPCPFCHEPVTPVDDDPWQLCVACGGSVAVRGVDVNGRGTEFGVQWHTVCAVFVAVWIGLVIGGEVRNGRKAQERFGKLNAYHAEQRAKK